MTLSYETHSNDLMFSDDAVTHTHKQQSVSNTFIDGFVPLEDHQQQRQQLSQSFKAL